jgi:hypothetical protein
MAIHKLEYNEVRLHLNDFHIKDRLKVEEIGNI